MCPLKADLLSVTFDPETAEYILHFPSLPGFPHKGHWTQANQILPDVRRLDALSIHRENFGKIRSPKNLPQFMLTILTSLFATFSLDAA